MRTLERQYRLLLHAYPRRYRRLRGEEILGTLLDAATPGQRQPTRADVADLLGGGLRERLGLNALPGLANGLRLAGPIALALTAGLAAGSWLTGARHAAGMVVAAAWVAAVLARVALPRAGAGPAALAWLITIGVAVDVDGLHLWQGVQREWFLAPVVLGAIAIAGTLHQPAHDERVGLGAGTAGLVALSLVGRAGPVPLPNDYLPAPVDVTFNLPEWAFHAWVVPVGLAVAGVALATGRRGTRGLWAALILLIPVPLLVQPAHLPWRPLASRVVFMTYAPELFALMLALVVAIAVNVAAHAREAGTDREAAADILARCGRLSLAAVAGLAASVLLAEVVEGGARAFGPGAVGRALVAAAPLGGRWLPPWLTRVLLGAGLTGVVGGAVAGRAFEPGWGALIAVAMLGVIALVAWGRTAQGAATLTVTAVAVTAVTAYGFSRTPADFYVIIPGADLDCPDVAACAALPWSWLVIPFVTTAVLVPILVGAAVAELLGGGIRARAVFVVALLWCLATLGPQLPALGYAIVAALAYGLLHTARVTGLRLRGGLPANAGPT